MSEETAANDELVTIASFQNAMEADLARAGLESAGIDVFLQGENANRMIALGYQAHLQVRSQDEAEARKLLAEANDNPETLESVTAAEIASE